MWFTPWRSSTSSVRSASAWLAWASAAPPNRVTVLWCPVRPNARRSIMAGSPPAGMVSGREEERHVGPRGDLAELDDQVVRHRHAAGEPLRARGHLRIAGHQHGLLGVRAL